MLKVVVSQEPGLGLTLIVGSISIWSFLTPISLLHASAYLSYSITFLLHALLRLAVFLLLFLYLRLICLLLRLLNEVCSAQPSSFLLFQLRLKTATPISTSIEMCPMIYVWMTSAIATVLVFYTIAPKCTIVSVLQKFPSQEGLRVHQSVICQRYLVTLIAVRFY